MDWRKPTYSDSNGGACVETASGNGLVFVRDTTNRDGGTLGFTSARVRMFDSPISNCKYSALARVAAGTGF